MPYLNNKLILPAKETPVFATPEYTVGKHVWRMIVYVGQDMATKEPRRYTSYQFKGAAGAASPAGWCAARDWPQYNPNDTYDGLPRSLEKIYTRHKEQIHAALENRPMPKRHDLFSFGA